jgi:hypothetical protein
MARGKRGMKKMGRGASMPIDSPMKASIAKRGRKRGSKR